MAFVGRHADTLCSRYFCLDSFPPQRVSGISNSFISLGSVVSEVTSIRTLEYAYRSGSLGIFIELFAIWLVGVVYVRVLQKWGRHSFMLHQRLIAVSYYVGFIFSFWVALFVRIVNASFMVRRS